MKGWIVRTFPHAEGLDGLDWLLLPFAFALLFGLMSATFGTIMHDYLGISREKIWTNDANLLGEVCTMAEQDRRIGRTTPSDPVMLADPVDRPRLNEFRRLYPSLAREICLDASNE